MRLLSKEDMPPVLLNSAALHPPFPMQWNILDFTLWKSYGRHLVNCLLWNPPSTAFFRIVEPMVRMPVLLWDKLCSLPAFVMHPFPCSTLLSCFGSVTESTPVDQSQPTCLTPEEQRKLEPEVTICDQPLPARYTDSLRLHKDAVFRPDNCAERCTLRFQQTAHRNSSKHVGVPSTATPLDSSVFSDESLGHDTTAVLTQIPRPSIIKVPKVSTSLTSQGVQFP